MNINDIDFKNLPLKALKQLMKFREKMEVLERGMMDLVKTALGSEHTAEEPTVRTGRRKMSASARAKIAAAQRKRWAKTKGNGTVAIEQKSRKRKMSAAGRAAISAGAKARWAKAKAAGKSTL